MSLDVAEARSSQRAFSKPMAALGAFALREAFAVRSLVFVFLRTLYFTFKRGWAPGEVVRQMFEIGNRSLFFIGVTMGPIGMILVYQAGLQSARLLPDYSLLGGTFIGLLVRDFAASIGALMLATRVGAGMAAEIGSMVVTEQVDAFTMCGADPVEYLIAPRFVASMIMTPVLVVVGGFIAYGAGALTAHSSFGVSYSTFFNLSMVSRGDLITGLAKCVAYGAAIPIVSGDSGLRAYGGSAGVGRATTDAVVRSSLAVIILDFLVSAASVLIFGH